MKKQGAVGISDNASTLAGRPFAWWIKLPAKLLTYGVMEVAALLTFAIQRWPNTPLGFALRNWYWRRKTGLKSLMIWRGAQINDPGWIEFNENLMMGENAEIISDGVDNLRVFLGPNVVMARGVYVRSANHRFDDPDSPMLEQGHISKRVDFRGQAYAIVIEGNCWIGANAIILSGTHIGQGAVVGAGAVVSGIVPARAIVAGSPARVIKFLHGGSGRA